MAGIFTRFTLRSLAQNRVRTAVTVVGIALSTALLAAVLTSVASVQQGLLERTMVTEGSWHVFSPDVPAQGIDALVESDAVTDLATFRDLGSAALAPDDANRLGAFIALKTTPTTVKGVDEPGGAPYSLMPELASGRWPETADEIVLPDYLQGEEAGAREAPRALFRTAPLKRVPPSREVLETSQPPKTARASPTETRRASRTPASAR